jgi:predicted nucleic acid-binding protein
MSRIVLLDAGPLGLATNPRPIPEAQACGHWIETLVRGGTLVLVPEIADYEVRRELLRARKMQGVRRLDQLVAAIGYVPLTTAAMRHAAEFWAAIRQTGKPTADAKALDGDVILAAQATVLAEQGHDIVVATTNVGHLRRFVAALEWQNIG